MLNAQKGTSRVLKTSHSIFRSLGSTQSYMRLGGFRSILNFWPMKVFSTGCETAELESSPEISDIQIKLCKDIKSTVTNALAQPAFVNSSPRYKKSLMNTLMKHQRLLNVWGIQFKKNFTVNNTLTEAMFEHELVPAVSSAHGDEVPITGLDEFNWELKVDKWVEEIDFMNLASRKRQVITQPLLIASCLELIALHIDSLEGKPSIVICNPAIKSSVEKTPNPVEVTSKLMGIGFFLTLIKQNSTCRLIYHDPHSVNVENMQADISDAIKSFATVEGPIVVINTWTNFDSSKIVMDEFGKSLQRGDDGASLVPGKELVHINSNSYTAPVYKNFYDLKDIERIAPLVEAKTSITRANMVL